MDYWNSILTEKSWNVLLKLKKEKFNFIVIGGWAAYLWTNLHKSKDIDIILKDFNDLEILKKEHELRKNDSLRKYEIKRGEIDVDIYVSHFSKLIIPPEHIENYISKIEGFSVISKEALLILKQGAEIERRNSLKGEKDKLDIMSLLFFSDINFSIYKSILKKYSLEHFIDSLIYTLKTFKDYNSLNLTPREFKKTKENILRNLKKL